MLGGKFVKKPLRAPIVRVLLTMACLSVLGIVVVPGVSSAKAKVKAPEKYYLSLGDSYSVGYQPVPLPDGAATVGFTGYAAKKLKLQLENFGCGGATTASLAGFTGVCGVTGYGPPAATDAATIPSGDSQVTAAEGFIAAHAGQVAL